MLNRCRIVLLLAWLFAGATSPARLVAQMEFDEYSKLNTNVSFPVSVFTGSTSHLTAVGTGLVMGAGYNFNEHHAFVGEFMWNWLYPTNESLAPLRAAMGPGELNGHSNLYSATANYRFEVRDTRMGGVGVYLIGGAGVYIRDASLTREVTPVPGTACTPVWQWWGFHCSNGVVLTETRDSFASAVAGGNAGIGFTIKVGEPRYRVYFEARYHYVPTSNTIVRFIPISTGIRF